jgi:hypothetical protein
MKNSIPVDSSELFNFTPKPKSNVWVIIIVCGIITVGIYKIYKDFVNSRQTYLKSKDADTKKEETAD